METSLEVESTMIPSPNPKIMTLDTLAELRKSFRKNKQKTIHCHGVFDLLHIGHIRYFQQAKQLGDILVVTITPDKFVDKGPKRPAFNEHLRAEAVASLSTVDYVAVNQWSTAENTIHLLKPDVYVKGSDFKNAASDITGKLAKEEKVVRDIGAEIAFTNDIVFSSTKLINRFLDLFPEEIRDYLTIFRSRYDTTDICSQLERMASLEVTIIGDTILDDYHYCKPIGASTKDPALAVHYQSHDLFPGGVLAIANHVADFVKKVRLITVLGENDIHEAFIKSNLHRNVDLFSATKKGSPTIIKRRFVDGYSMNKLFEVYIMDDAGLPEDEDKVFCRIAKDKIENSDVVIVGDYGHGAISDNLRQVIIKQAPFLSINTQSNSGNRGFNAITRYSRADYISLTEPEVRLAMHDKDGNIKLLMERVRTQLSSKYLAVTLGKKGCLILGKKGNFIEVPAFAHEVVDLVGAGDAFFAITTLAAFLKVDPELIGFIGNVVGALAVNIIGNQKSIDKMNLIKYTTSLLK